MRPFTIVRTAAGALLRSLLAGVDTVDAAVYQRRLDACRTCELCVDPPDTLLHALGKPVSDPRICALCGCFVFKKARYSTERCPAADPNDDTRTRWHEPRERNANA